MSTYLERLRARELENVKIVTDEGENDENQADDGADDSIFIKNALGEGEEPNSVKCENLL